MQRTHIAEVQPGGTCRVQGFLENIRDKRTMAFLVVRDITGKIQLTIDKAKRPDLAEIIPSLTLESVVTVEGPVLANPSVKLNGLEMLPNSLVLESKAEALPIQEDSAIDLRLDYRWLDLRSEKNTLIFQVQTALMQYIRNMLCEKNFIELHTPKLIGTASESGADVFELNYFDRKAYLAQSPQFYKQMAMAAGFERIYEIGPVFRAEKSYTNKHTTEYTSFDIEVSYIDSYRDIMRIEEELLTDALRMIKTRYGEAIQRLFGIEVVVPTLPFPEIKLADLYDELEKRYGFTVPETEKGDLNTESERMAFRYAQEVYGHEFLFVTNYGVDKRPFYHMRSAEGVPEGFDLYWRGIEITTGAQREHRYDILRQQADEKGLTEDVKFYMEFFRYGCPPHGGFGLGVDRLTMVLLNQVINQTMFLFRSPNRLSP